MKTKILTLITFIITSLSFAQGGGFNYKALITDNDNVLATHPVTFRFTVLENGTTSVYQETQSATTDANGIVAVNVGEGSTISGNFSTIDWSSNPYFLKIEIDTGSGYQDYGTSEFKSVPYAKYAETGGSVKILQDLENVSESNNGFFLISDNYTNTGAANYAIGVNALHSNTSGGGNISLGYNNLYDNTSGSNNIALGSASLGNNTTGEANIAIGTQALYENSTTNNNIAIGISALKFYTGTGYAYTGENVAIGDDALKNLHSGVGNTVIGANAAISGNSGSRNVYIGYNAATNASGDDNIFIGHSAGANETGSNKLYIENSNSSSPLIYGEFDNDLVKINGTLQVSDGSQGNGKVLTSDASGVASWQTPATFTDLWSSNGSNIYRNNGNVGIGTSTPDAPLEIRSDASASLIIGSYSPNYNIRPGIQFKNNTSQYIAGDDGSNEIFGFYSKWGNSRTYDAKLRIYGKASGSWGKYIEITHDGSDASIKTDTGNISLEPSGGEVQVNGKITAPATGSNDMKAFAYGTIDSNGSILSGTGNFHVDHNLGAGIYKISFTGENYDDSHFTTVVSVHDTYWPSFIFCYATNNTLVVKIFDADGTTKENMPFSFVTYKK